MGSDLKITVYIYLERKVSLTEQIKLGLLSKIPEAILATKKKKNEDIRVRHLFGERKTRLLKTGDFKLQKNRINAFTCQYYIT